MLKCADVVMLHNLLQCEDLLVSSCLIITVTMTHSSTCARCVAPKSSLVRQQLEHVGYAI